VLSRWRFFADEAVRSIYLATIDRIMQRGIIFVWFGVVVFELMVLTSFVNPAIALTNEADCAATSRQLTTITQAQVAQLFDRWNAALQSGKPEAVAENYSEQAILLPTLSSQVRHNRAEITDYFRQFTALKPVGKIEEHNIQIFGDTAIDAGIYSFTGVKDNKPFKVLARYSFVYHQQGDRWLIVEHHSSLLPEQAS